MSGQGLGIIQLIPQTRLRSCRCSALGLDHGELELLN